MVKIIYTLLVLSLVSFSCTTSGSVVAESKYPEYTISQAKLLVDTGKCKIVTGTLREDNFKMALLNGMGTIRVYEPIGNSKNELLSAINSYVELDNANAFILYEMSGKYAFTTMRCS